MADVESLVADFVADISEVVKAYWGPLAEEVGFASAHIIIGVFEQVKQKVLEDLNEELLKAIIKEEEVVFYATELEQKLEAVRNWLEKWAWVEVDLDTTKGSPFTELEEILEVNKE